MWESRVLGEISKSLWKPFCGFHRDVISIAVFSVGGDRADKGKACTLAGLLIVVPEAAYAVFFDPPTSPSG